MMGIKNFLHFYHTAFVKTIIMNLFFKAELIVIFVNEVKSTIDPWKILIFTYNVL